VKKKLRHHLQIHVIETDKTLIQEAWGKRREYFLAVYFGLLGRTGIIPSLFGQRNANVAIV